MNVGIITQARMTSTRLPGKVLLPMGDQTVLDHHVDRLAWSGLPLVIATTNNVDDDPVVELATRRGIYVHRGSEHDVLARFIGAAQQVGLEAIVRVTSDCPLVDGHLIREAVDRWLFLGDPYAYLANTLNRTYPRGFDLEVFSTQALQTADTNASSQSQREHVTPYLYSGVDRRMTLHGIARPDDGAGDFRLTLDTPTDYEVLKRLVEEHDAHQLVGEDLIALVRRHPELREINSHIEQKTLGD